MKIKTVAKNKKAFHLFKITDRIEAGIELQGTEVKSIRMGKVVMQDCYAVVRGAQMYIEGLHISPYDPASSFNHEAKRKRKLLLHKKEIEKFSALIQAKGSTIIPLSIYFKGRMVKVELGVGRGKKDYDKRETIKERDSKRDISRALKNNQN